MIVGILRLTFHIHGASSLKDKRSVLRKLRDRVRSRFNVSWNEVSDQDVHERAVIGVSAISSDERYLDGLLNKVVDEVEATYVAELVDREMELVHWFGS